MKSKRQLGNYLQNKCADWLEKNGYIVHNQKSVAKAVITNKGVIWVSQRNDILGCIDILAIKPDKKTLFIQVTADTNISRKLNDLKQIKWNFNHSDIQLWRYAGHGRWIIYKLTKEYKFKKYFELIRNQKKNC